MSDARETTGQFASPDGLTLFYRTWIAEKEKARLLIAHGVGEHSGRYENVVQELLPMGISLWAYDHRGHGRSEGRRGHVLSFSDYVDDLAEMVKIASSGKPPRTRLFLLGHSMGGVIATRFVQRFPKAVDGLIVSSPALGLAVRVPAIKGFIGKMMSSIWPSLTLGNELDVSAISRDPDTVAAYEQDPLVHDRVSTRWFTEFLKAMEETNRHAGSIRVPVLLQVAGADRIVDSNAARVFFERIGAIDKSLCFYDGLFHEIYNETEPDRTRVLGDLRAWLSARVGPAEGSIP